jgi:hypothetical protein
MTATEFPLAAASVGSFQEKAFHPIPPSGAPRKASSAADQKRPLEEVR